MKKNRFRSRSEHVLDNKGRLNFPSRFRDVLSGYKEKTLMVTAWGDSHLRIYPLKEWEIIENKLMTKGREQPGLARFVRFVVSGVTECSVDKQGRLLIAATLRKETNIVKDVTLTGMLDWVEIWDKDAWELENTATKENFAEYEEGLAKLGIF